mgnify:CR=1 FL=1
MWHVYNFKMIKKIKKWLVFYFNHDNLLKLNIKFEMNLNRIYNHYWTGTHDLSERLNFSLTLSTSFLATSILPLLPSCTSICSLTTLASQSNKTTDFPTLKAGSSGKKALTSPVSSPKVHLSMARLPWTSSSEITCK